MREKEHTNRLIREKSPYLLQHAHNPVDWYPWGGEAFEKARAEDKPVFLSIGYSTCHWCHVMERESFEDEEVAAALNRDFVAVKVDREERPDVDAVYMTVCQAVTGSGGWPLTVLMSPDQKPFYAGTYLPKDSRYSMPGLLDLLSVAAEQWRTARGELLRSGDRIVEAMRAQTAKKEAARPEQERFAAARRLFAQSYDEKYGGFGGSPKFPSPHNLMFLLRYHARERDEAALSMVEHTLRQMYRGGIFDHIGFGFSRYSTDRMWLAPHFEKMLYDNALLTMAYLETFQVTGDAFYRETAEKILTYVRREMTAPEGGFYSAQDADSDGAEGGYYLFGAEEILRLLGEEDGAFFNEYFGMTREGNFEGKNIPNLLQNGGYGRPDARISALLPKVYDYRSARTRLRCDDKILTSWNALMIAALAKAARITGNAAYLEEARNAARFLRGHLSENGSLFVRWRDGEAFGAGGLDDYAFSVWALLELYDADFQAEDLELALRLCRKLLRDFWDGENGGFFLSGAENRNLIFSPKEAYDGALPSGNSVAGYCLVRLAALTAKPELEQAAERQLEFLAGAARAYPAGCAFSLTAQMDALYPGTQLVAVMKDEADLKTLRQILRKKFRPGLTVLVLDAKNRDKLGRIAGFTKDYTGKDGQSTFFVCRGSACLPPVSGFDGLEEML